MPKDKKRVIKIQELKHVLTFLKQNYAFLLFPFVLIFGIYIRTRNLPLLKDKYPLALDPYLFLRYAKEIVDKGVLPAMDWLRYSPIGFPTFNENVFISYVIAYLYKIIHVFIPTFTVEQAAIYYPVVFFAIGLIIFFVLVWKLFNKETALISSLFLVIVPSYLQRTMAGFADKEALAITFMYLAFLFYYFSVKKKSYIYGLLSGISTGFMGLSWGGYKFALMIIVLFNTFLFLTEKNKRRIGIVILSWFLPMVIIVSVFTGKYGGFDGILTSETVLANLVVIIAFLGYGYVKKFIDKKFLLPATAASFIVVILGLILFKEQIYDIVNPLMVKLLHPLSTSRLGLTVGENRQPYFDQWFSIYNMFFYVFYLGAIYIFYRTVSVYDKYNYYLTAGFIILISGLIFSRVARNAVLNGDNMISQVVFFGSFIVFGLSILYVMIKEKTKKLDLASMFLLSWFIITILSARGAVRLFFILSPVVAIVAAYFLYLIFKEIMPILNDNFYKIATTVMVLILMGSIAYGFTNYSLGYAKAAYPSYHEQWQFAMDWVRENTAVDSVFAHWWDYGYWVQTGGQRATILDGMNRIGYWNHLMGRNVLSAKSEDEALQFLASHNATHLLIISDEISKYTAYSSIGSDDNFDIFSWIDYFVMDPRRTDFKENITRYYFIGGSPLDENFVYNDVVYPKNQAYIVGFYVEIFDENITQEIMQPYALLSYNNQIKEIPVECVYDQ